MIQLEKGMPLTIFITFIEAGQQCIHSGPSSQGMNEKCSFYQSENSKLSGGTEGAIRCCHVSYIVYTSA